MTKIRLTWLFALICAMGVATTVNAQYCTTGVGPTLTADSNVEQVDITGDLTTAISHTGCVAGGVAGVEDLTAQSVDLTAGSSYNLDVTFGTCGGNYAGIGTVWIDWNQDGVFDDATENLGVSSGTPGSTWTGPVTFGMTVPVGAWNGATRMRVVQREGSVTPTSCGGFNWGSVMDFTVNISGGFTPTCGSPSALNASNITETGADLAWTVGPNAESTWDLHIVAAGDPAPADADPGNYPDVASTLYAFAASSGTDYEFYVRADCAPADSSFWVGPVAFSTPAACGDTLSGCYSTNSGNTILTDITAPMGQAVVLEVIAGQVENNYDEFIVLDGPIGTGVELYNGYGATGDLTGLSITSLTGQLVAYVSADISGTCSSNGYTPIELTTECTSCLDLTNVSVDNVLDVSGDVSWDANPLDPAATYTVDVQQGGFSIAGYPVTGVTGSSYAMTGLTVDSDYSVIVTPDCDALKAVEVLFSTLSCAPASRCSYTLTVSDFGDGGGVNYNGWVTGAVVQVTAGNQVSTYSVPAGTYGGPQSIDHTVLACPGDSLKIEYIGTPENAGETWSITGPGGLNYQPAAPSDGLTVISCPTCAPAFGLATSNVCETSFDASWTNGAAYDSVEVTWNYFVPPFFFFSGTSGVIPSAATTATVSSGASAWPLNSSINYSVIGYCAEVGGVVEQSQVDGSFTTPICACAEQCSYTLIGEDDYGDGWNGNNFDIVVDGVIQANLQDITSNGGDGPDSVVVSTCPGQNLELVFHPGSYDEEVIVTLESSIAGVVYSGPAGTFDGVADGTIVFSETTCPACIAPTELAAINLASDSARIVWSDPAGAADFDIAIELAGGTAAAGTYTNVTPDTTYLAQTLTPQTDYTAYLTAICATGVSDTVEVNFSTLCGPEVAPYVETFENGGSIPDCWEQGATNGENWVFSTGTLGHIGNDGTFGSSASGGYMAAVDDSGTHNTGTTLLSPMIDVSALTSPELAFYLLSNNEGNTNVDFSVDVYDGAAWNTAVYSSNSNTVAGDWELITVDLSTLAITGDIQLRFVVDENNGTDFYDDVAIDDVEVREKPNCPAPTAMAASNITETSADLAWSAGAAEGLWDLHIVDAGAAAPAEADPGNYPDLATAAYSFTSGMAASSYDVYYRAECGVADTSAWVGPYTFSTLSLSDLYCAAGPTSAADSNVDTVGVVGDNGSAISLTGCPGVIGVQDVTSDTLEVTAGMTYTMTVGFSSCGGNYSGAGEAWIDFDNSLSYSTAESIVQSAGTPGTAPWDTDVTFTFTVPYSAVDGAVVGMRVMQAESGSNPLDPCGSYTWGSVMDFAVSITNDTPCPGVSGVAETITGATTADVTWSEVGPATLWNVEYGEGATPGDVTNTATNVATTPSISLTGLVAGTTYYAHIQSDCGADSSAFTTHSWVQPTPGATCDLPIEITSVPYTSGTINSDGYGDDYSASPCNGSYMGGDDVVFRYSPATSVCHSITFNAITTWQGFHILDGCPDDAATTCLYTGTSPSMFTSATGPRVIESFAFTGGQDYYFVASTWPSPQSGTFEFSLGDCPDCIAPTDLSANDITGTSARIGFNSTVAMFDGTHAYSYAYGLNGFDIATEAIGGGNDIVASLVQDTVDLAGLMGSTTYQFCMWENCEALNPGDGQSDTVCVSFQTLISNDDCVDAAPIACGDTILGFTTGANTSDFSPYITGTNQPGDVFFTFVGENSDDPAALVGTTGNQVTMDLCNSAYDTKIDVYTSCTPASAADWIGGNDDACGTRSSLSFATVVGTTYYVRVYGYFSTGNFELIMNCESPCLPVPANDECANAEILTLQTYGDAPATEGTNSCASLETFNPTCDPFGVILGVWYNFETHSSGETYFSLETDAASSLGNGAATQIHYAIYSGDQCNGTGVQEVCADTPGADPYTNIFYQLEADSVYQLLVWTNDAEAGDFLVGVTGPPPPPLNDDATGAELLAMSVSNECTDGVAGTLVAATQSATPLSGECGTQTNGHNDVWYKVVVPASGRVLIDFPVQPGANMFTELSTGTAGALTYVPLSCSAINPKAYPLRGVSSASALTPGDSLYIRIWDAGNNDIGDFEICVTDPAPVNDACANATPAPVTDHGTPGWIEGRSDFAFEAANSCGDGTESVFYSFTATDANQVIYARAIDGGDYDAVIEVFDGCEGTSMGCFNNYGEGMLERAMPGNLVEGSDYVYSVSHAGGASDASSDAFETGVRQFNDASLNPDYCDVLTYTLDDAVYASRDDLGQMYTNPNVPVTLYGIRFQEVGGGLDVSIDLPAGITYVQLDDVPGLEYGKTYDVSVRHQVQMVVNGATSFEWSDYQSSCVIGLEASVPSTQLSAEFCNTLDHYLVDQVFADPIIGATTYEFTFVGGGDTFVKYSNNYTVFLYSVGDLQYNTVYTVSVRANVNGLWSPVVNTCSIGMASNPEDTEVQSQYCGGTYAFPQATAEYTNVILATQVYGAEEYTFRFTPQTTGGPALEAVTSGLSLSMHLIDIDLVDDTYTVDVKVQAGGVYSDYLNACNITIVTEAGAGVIAPPVDGDDIAVKSIAINSAEVSMYPNPSNGENVTINLSGLTDENQKITVEVLDLMGKTVHAEQLVNKGSEATFNLNFDNELSAGMYLVNLTVNNQTVVEKLTVK